MAQIPKVRLDRYLAAQLEGLTRSYIQKLIRAGLVHVNGAPVEADHRLFVGEIIEVNLPPPSDYPLEPEAIPLDILYEDADLLVINKPAGLTVHPAPGHTSHTLVNALLAHCPQLTGICGTKRPGIVHRLDKDTSGLLVVAKTERAQQSLSQQISQRTAERQYITLVHGHLSPERGLIEAPIGRHPVHRQRMAVVADGRPAKTRYRVVKYLPDYTLAEVTLETGRTHQIRVHFAAIGHPVVGDRTYGRPSPLVDRQFLHAHRLRFHLPKTGDPVEFTTELPADLKTALATLEGVSPAQTSAVGEGINPHD